MEDTDAIPENAGDTSGDNAGETAESGVQESSSGADGNASDQTGEKAVTVEGKSSSDLGQLYRITPASLMLVADGVICNQGGPATDTAGNALFTYTVSGSTATFHNPLPASTASLRAWFRYKVGV